jgi:hypothetical protein
MDLNIDTACIFGIVFFWQLTLYILDHVCLNWNNIIFIKNKLIDMYYCNFDEVFNEH